MTPPANKMRLLLARIDQIIESDTSPADVRQQVKQAFFDIGYDAPSAGTFTVRLTFDNGQTRVINNWPHRHVINAAINSVQDRRITEITFIRDTNQQREAEQG